MAVEKTLPGEFGKGAFWGAVISSGLMIIAGVFSPAVAGGILTWGLAGGAVMATIHGINKLAGSIAEKK